MTQAIGYLGELVLFLVVAAIIAHWIMEFTHQPIRWPRTLRGWEVLWWIFLERCPIDHARLLTDPWSGGDALYCFKCNGVSMWPANVVLALQGNHRRFHQVKGKRR